MADCREIKRKTLSVTDKLNILKMYDGKVFLIIKQLDVSFKKQYRNILLFVDDCPAHPTNIPLENIQILKLQPLDQGIIKVLKQRYRKKLILRYLKEMESKNIVAY